MMPQGHIVKRKGGWTPIPFMEKKIQLRISGIKRKYMPEFEKLAEELKKNFLKSKETKDQ